MGKVVKTYSDPSATNVISMLRIALQKAAILIRIAALFFTLAILQCGKTTLDRCKEFHQLPCFPLMLYISLVASALRDYPRKHRR